MTNKIQFPILNMRRNYFLLLLLIVLFFPISLLAKDKITNGALVTVNTFDKANKPFHSGCGFFVSNTGEAVAPYSLFEGAFRAELIDSKGHRWQVTRIQGASDLYDVVKFRTDCTQSDSYTLAQAPVASGTDVTRFISNGKKGFATASAHISETKKYEGITYYTLASKADDATAGTPVFDTKGQVIGIMQKNAEKTPTQSFAADIAVQKYLTTSALSAGETALNKIFIPKQLPSDTTQAASYLYFLTRSSSDSISYLAALSDFKTAYPDVATGYVEQANFYAFSGRYAAADAEYTEAFKRVKNQAEVHYNLARLIYKLNLSHNYKMYSDWNLERALSEVQRAQGLSPLPLYQLLQGDCEFALKQYQQAFDTYQALNQTKFASAETFFYAARSREMLNNDSLQVLALMDSAVARFREPYKSDAAPFILQRAQYRQKYQHFKDAAMDYDTYEKVVGTQNLNDKFFYLKEQVDIAANYYPWALNDIDKALQINPKEYLYVVEKAVVQLRVGNNDEAIYAAEQALKLNPDGADAYKVLGIAYGQQNKKDLSLKNLQKAKELGDPQVDEWIQKMKK